MTRGPVDSADGREIENLIVRRDGGWRGVERNVNIRLVGDVSKQLRS